MQSDLALYLVTGLFLILLALLICWRWHRSKPTPATSQPPQRKRAPKPFAGSTHKPACALCDSAGASHPQLPSAPPPRMLFTRGRRRQVTTSGHFCPHPPCSYHGRVGWGNLRANGHPNGRRGRQLGGLSCQRHFLEPHGTPLHGKQGGPEQLGWAIAALAEGLGIRAVARVCETDPNTMLGWLGEAAEHLEACSRPFVHDLDVEQVQMDELFALRSAVKAGEISEHQASKRLSRSPHWVWVAMDPVGKLILAGDVGDRTLARAHRLGHQVTRVLAPDCAPVFCTDGFCDYRTARVTHDGRWLQPERRQAKGPQPKPRWMPWPELLYAQVVKCYRRRRLVGGTHRVVFGPAATIESILARRGWQINTAFAERLPLDFRQHVAAIGRRVNTLCNHEAGRGQQLTLFHAYHNFVLPHASWRVPLPELEPGPGTGAVKRWQPRTPALAAGLTDRSWSVRERLMYRVPPWPRPSVH